MSACPSCGYDKTHVFCEMQAVPSNSCILLDNQDDAIAYPRGDIALGFCSRCGFISNEAFDETLTVYSSRYEETQGFSPTFTAFHRLLADRLIDKYGIRGKRIIEIGCGKGEFLALLCELGGNTGIGFDPSYAEGRLHSPALKNIHFIRDFYSESYASYKGDFVVCKMTLEHIHRTFDFVATIRRALQENLETIVFFQVPDAVRILRDCAFEDIYYEHCSYFSPESLARLFCRCGFEVLDVGTEYEGQYLTIESRPSNHAESRSHAFNDDLSTLRSLIEAFPGKLNTTIETWKSRLADLAAENRKTVLWGSGSKAVSFLNNVDDGGVVEFVVDINPYRHGHYMPGSGRKIISPELLKEYAPDAVIIMNSVYCNEIRKMLATMGMQPQLFHL